MNGVVNFLKPPGMSSNGAVVFIRGVMGVRKTGHAGTLDPGACGVLPVCVGKATKISSYMMGAKKEYIAEAAFGVSTDTLDSYGRVAAVSSAPLPGRAEVEAALQTFVGQISQQTPAYSAAKIGGRKRYQLARAGIETQPQVRDVQIYAIEYLEQTRDNAHLIKVSCGKGTYIRSLVEDLGKHLGTLAYLSFLVRTKCAGLDIADSVTADELKEMGEDRQRQLLPIERFLQGMPKAVADLSQRHALFNGIDVAFEGQDTQTVCIYAGEELMGIGSLENGRLKISTRLVDE